MAHRQAKYQVRRQGVADNVDVPTPWYLAPYLSKINCTYGDWLNFTQALYNGVNAVVTPYSGPAYDQARADFYVQFDIYPLMVVFCTTTDDVALAISFAAAHKLKVAPRSGRHCTAGFSVLEEGVCIDTSGIKGVVVNDSDPDNPYAVVGAGTIWDQVNRELERLNYHTTGGGCPTVGVAGYSMGGGYGFTARSFGLACDNVLEIEIVLASGQVVVANETQNSYLLTAFKGGMGGNFGTVTQITFRIYPLTTVYGCLIEYNINDAALVLNTYMSNFTNNPNTDKRVGIQAVLCHTEDNAGKLTPIVSIACIFVGPTADAQTALKPLLDLKYEKFTSYPDQKYSYINYHILDPIEGIIPTTIVSEYKMSRYIPRVLSQSELQRIIDWYLTTPGQYNICAFESYGGAISNPRWGPDSFVHRENMCDFFCDSFYQPGTPCDYNAAKNWAYNFLVKNPYQLFSPTSYQNYPHMDYPEWETAYFGDQSNGVYRFLQAVKAKVDPTCMFYYPQGVFPLPVGDPDVLKLPELEIGQKSMLSKRRFVASSTPTLTSSYDEKKFKEETKPVEKTYNNEKQPQQKQQQQQQKQKEKRSSKIARAMKKAFRSVFMCCLDQELPRGVDANQIDNINNGEPYRSTRPQKHYRQKRI